MDNKSTVTQLLISQENTICKLEHSIAELTSQLQQLKAQQSELRKFLDKGQVEKEATRNLITSESKKQTEAKMARELNKAQKKVIQLKNGQVNIPFQEKIMAEEFGIPPNANIRFEGIEQLTWQAEQQLFEGIPSQAGEFIGTFKFNIDSDFEHEKEVHFLVNPDPRTLWQSIDPPEEAPYYKPNTDFIHQAAGSKAVTALSARGKSHAHKGSFREDHTLTHYNEEGWVIQVVSDGAGSAKYSRQGSKIACEATIQYLNNYLTNNNLNPSESLFTSQQDDSIHHHLTELCIATAQYAHEQIKHFAHAEGQSSKAFASTLLFAISKTFDFGTVVIAFSIGDGAIAVIDEKNVELLMTPDGGEYSGQTRFITMAELFTSDNKANLNKRVQWGLFKNHKATLLMTDGVSDPKFGTDNKLKDPMQWRSLWSELESILNDKTNIESNLFNWLDFYIPGEYDDRTLSILA